jgi:ketosteroid isomerase-like protein
MKRIIFLGLIFFALTASAQQAIKKQVDLKTEEQAIRSISMKWLELVNNHDAAGIAALFANDGIEYNENQEPAVGPVAIQKSFIQTQLQNPKEVVNWTTDRVEIAASGDLAIEYGSWTDTGLGLNGMGKTTVNILLFIAR